MTEYYIDPNDFEKSKNPAFVQFIMDLGFARTPKQANIILISIFVIFLIVSIYLFSKVFSDPNESIQDFGDPLLEEELL